LRCLCRLARRSCVLPGRCGVEPNDIWPAKVIAADVWINYSIHISLNHRKCGCSIKPNSGNLVFHFSPTDCQPCSLRQRCSRAKSGGRTLTVYPQHQYQALLQAREQQETDEFKEQYAARAGIEGTISQATRTMKVRRSRYIGLDRTRLQHVATAAAINVSRLANWLQGERPAPTRSSPFLKLAAQMA
jgi:hypothetical protein